MHCCVIGSGPSIKDFRYMEYRYFLTHGIMIGVNQCYRFFEPNTLDYLCFLDKIMLGWLDEDMFQVCNPTTIIVSHHLNNANFNIRNGFGFSPGILYDGGNSGYLGLQLAGNLPDVDTIFLFGFDMGDYNYFSNKTRSSVSINKDDEVKRLQDRIFRMNELIFEIEKTGRQVINVRGHQQLKNFTSEDLRLLKK